MRWWMTRRVERQATRMHEVMERLDVDAPFSKLASRAFAAAAAAGHAEDDDAVLMRRALDASLRPGHR